VLLLLLFYFCYKKHNKKHNQKHNKFYFRLVVRKTLQKTLLKISFLNLRFVVAVVVVRLNGCGAAACMHDHDQQEARSLWPSRKLRSPAWLWPQLGPQYSLTPPGPGNVTEDLVSHTGARPPPHPPRRAPGQPISSRYARCWSLARPPPEVIITTCRRPPVSRLIFVLLFCCFVVLFESNQQTPKFVARQVLYSSMSGFAG
jgi:hypothetical protein